MLVKRFLEVCHGLPLSLKVFGAQLHQNFSKQYWESLLHKISRILSEDIKEKLKISNNTLDHEEKEAFLEIVIVKRKRHFLRLLVFLLGKRRV